MKNNLNNFYNKQQLSDTFPADFSWRNVLAKPCILLFTLQQDCNTREACRLLLVVKVVFVVFPNSEGLIGNSTNPITRYFGRTFKVVLLENGVIQRGHMENNLNNFYNK